jgi:protein SCO1/2
MQTLPNSSNLAPRLTIAALALVGALGIAALSQATLGFRVVSSESARRLSILEQPRSLPAASVRLPEASSFEADLRADGRVAIVAFIYTSCNAICSVIGNQFQQLQQDILARGLERQVRLISVSFDPRDDAATLGAYARRQGALPAVWRFASVDDPAQRARLLDAFGIVVVPAPLGQFQHNAAFHLVGADNRLMRIDDFEAPRRALAHAIGLARAPRSGT